MFGPAEHAGLEESAINDELTPAFEQVKQAHLAPRPIELVVLLDGNPRDSPALGGERVAGAGYSLLLYQQLPARRLPFRREHDRGRRHLLVRHCYVSLSKLVDYHEDDWA